MCCMHYNCCRAVCVLQCTHTLHCIACSLSHSICVVLCVVCRSTDSFPLGQRHPIPCKRSLPFHCHCSHICSFHFVLHCIASDSNPYRLSPLSLSLTLCCGQRQRCTRALQQRVSYSPFILSLSLLLCLLSAADLNASLRSAPFSVQ
jgi:hypothetical protein